jgi:nucleoside 2-deoxyribosyltransferase
MSDRLIYLSGPITGITFGEASDWRDYTFRRFLELSGGKIKTLSPMRGKRYLDNNKPIDKFNDHRKQVLSSKRMIYTRDRQDTFRADAVLVNLIGATKVSIGTVIEIAWADANNVPIIVAMEESNIHRHPILDECCGVIVRPWMTPSSWSMSWFATTRSKRYS